MSIVISVALATICFTYQGTEECHPVLLGKNNATPIGEFTLNQRITNDNGYGGDVLQFHETKDAVYAIHRLWLLNPEQKRAQRLNSSNPKDRFISGGCINIDPVVYKRLLDCCINDHLIIK